jgi:hypothetical protein
MAEVEQVLRGPARATAVVDADPRHAVDGRGVDQDEGQAAGLEDVDALVQLVVAVDGEAVDQGGLEQLERGGAVGRARDQEQASGGLHAAAMPCMKTTAAGSVKA